MSKKNYLLMLSLFILIAGVFYYFIREEPIIPKADKQEAKQSPANTLSYIGSTLVEEKDGKRQWELTADKIEIDAATQDVNLTNLKGILYKENGEKIDLTAAHALVNNQTRNITMDGAVKAVASDGAVFTAQKADWVSGNRRFYAYGDVIMTRQDTVITGQKLESDGNLEKIKVSGNAHVKKGGAAIEQ